MRRKFVADNENALSAKCHARHGEDERNHRAIREGPSNLPDSLLAKPLERLFDSTFLLVAGVEQDEIAQMERLAGL